MRKGFAGRKVGVVVCGALGRMGSRIAALAQEDPRLVLVGGVVLSSDLSRAAPIPVSADLRDFLVSADVVVDFTEPAASLRHLRLAAGAGKGMVVGTTGFVEKQKREIRTFARKIPLMLSSNMSLGANLLFHLARQAAEKLSDYDAEIIELHHKHKKDAPSGTALRLAQTVAEARASLMVSGKEKDVGIASVRAGDVVGEHTLILAGEGERLEISHRASSRDVFARGALAAVFWIAGKKPGLYEMKQVLGL